MSNVEILDGVDIDFGRKMWQSLRDNKDFPIQGIFWLLEANIGGWHLVIASPRVDTLGPRDAYIELSPIMRNITDDASQRIKIELISPRHPLFQSLRSIYGLTGSVEGKRLNNTMVGGRFIDEAYLYEVR